MALIAVACVTAGAAINVAMDGGEPPRARTRAEASPFSTPVAAAPSRPTLATDSLRLPTFATSRVEDQEHSLSAALLSDNDDGARDLILRDPQAAARLAETQADPELRKLATHRLALLWGAQDPEHAVNWARSIPDAAERDATLIDIANGLSSVDPARGVDLREQFVAATQPDSALSNLVQQWATHDFDAALAWTNARAPGAQRDDLMQRLIYVRAAAGDPAAAARLVTESALTGEAKKAAVASVNQEWEQRDSTAAQEWRQTLDPSAPN
jgi:hypothetical protein